MTFVQFIVGQSCATVLTLPLSDVMTEKALTIDDLLTEHYLKMTELFI